MIEKEFLKLLKQKESIHLEFKSRIENPHKAARILAAFSNTSGGKLVVGVDDDKTIKGCSELEEMTKIIQAANELVVPPIDIQYSSYTHEGKRKVLIVNVQESSQKPHEAIDEKQNSIVFVRANDQTTPVTKEMTQILDKYDDTVDKELLAQPNVKALIIYLKRNMKVTAKEYAKLVNISPYRATKLLEGLTYGGILLMLSKQKPTQFVLKKW
ncbi:putative DNA-binding protein [Arcicella aurantiaca]|uniref:Putative DNA-binding protein n=1 Tax=Arcicella aurantiaca TaxID=591202 RepID=A0A316EDM7_9BACT|nr:ATP-binding protein [Arcicella aurantiaca]PWK26737.1 putative DNA-binding protein [Arcicella aurantiaca]